MIIDSGMEGGLQEGMDLLEQVAISLPEQRLPSGRPPARTKASPPPAGCRPCSDPSHAPPCGRSGQRGQTRPLGACAADAVVADLDDEVAVPSQARRTVAWVASGVLGDVRQRLGHREVGGGLDGLGQPVGGQASTTSTGNAVHATPAPVTAARQAALGENGGVDAARQLAQLGRGFGPSSACRCSRNGAAAPLGLIGDAAAGELLTSIAKRDEPLLSAVVEIAFDLAARAVGRLHGPSPAMTAAPRARACSISCARSASSAARRSVTSKIAPSIHNRPPPGASTSWPRSRTQRAVPSARDDPVLQGERPAGGDGLHDRPRHVLVVVGVLDARERAHRAADEVAGGIARRSPRSRRSATPSSSRRRRRSGRRRRGGCRRASAAAPRWPAAARRAAPSRPAPRAPAARTGCASRRPHRRRAPRPTPVANRDRRRPRHARRPAQAGHAPRGSAPVRVARGPPRPEPLPRRSDATADGLRSPQQTSPDSISTAQASSPSSSSPSTSTRSPSRTSPPSAL